MRAQYIVEFAREINTLVEELQRAERLLEERTQERDDDRDTIAKMHVELGQHEARLASEQRGESEHLQDEIKMLNDELDEANQTIKNRDEAIRGRIAQIVSLNAKLSDAYHELRETQQREQKLNLKLDKVIRLAQAD